MPNRDIIVIGGSAGAPAALLDMVGALPSDFAGSVFIVTHIPIHGAALLAGLLAVRTDLPVAYAQDGDEIEPGRILVAPADRHLMLTPVGVRLGLGARENHARPSIDVLFRSAAMAFNGRVIGVVLTGMLSDGAAGLCAIKACGGVTVVQDPASAFAPDMPRAAIAAADPDHIVALDEIIPLVVNLSKEEAPMGWPPSPQMRIELETAAGFPLGSARMMELGLPSPITCPECSGVLSQIKAEGPLRYRCQIGHAYNADIVDEQQTVALESALAVALRIIEERITLVRRLREDAETNGNTPAAELHQARGEAFQAQAEILRRGVAAAIHRRDDQQDVSPAT